MRRTSWKQYTFWILLTEAVGALSGWLTREGVKVYQAQAVKPPEPVPGMAIGRFRYKPGMKVVSL